MPASVTILAGQTNATFDLTILNIPGLDGTGFVNVTATALGYSTGSGQIQVYDTNTSTLSVTLPSVANAGDGPDLGDCQHDRNADS